MDGIKNNFIVISHVILVLVIVVVGFLYLKQQQQMSFLEAEINALKAEQIVSEEKELLQKTEDTPSQTQTPEERPDLFGEEQTSDIVDRSALIKKAKEEHFLEIISPKDGDQLCLGKKY